MAEAEEMGTGALVHLGDLMGAAQGPGREEGAARVAPGSPFLPAGVGPQVSLLARIVLSANGNLQRIASSWTNRPVAVEVQRNEQRPRDAAVAATAPLVVDRRVGLLCDGRQFGIAESVVTVSGPDYLEAVTSGKVGIGQLFRHFNLRPAFKLVHVEVQQPGAPLVRRYTLSSPGILCDITERLELELLDPSKQKPDGAASNEDKTPGTGAGAHYGDIMAGTTTAVTVSELGLLPMERVLATANGTVMRLLSSFLDVPVDAVIVDPGSPVPDQNSASASSAVFRRHVQLAAGGLVLCCAKSRIELLRRPTDEAGSGDALRTALRRVASDDPDARVLPRFELHWVTVMGKRAPEGPAEEDNKAPAAKPATAVPLGPDGGPEPAELVPGLCRHYSLRTDDLVVHVWEWFAQHLVHHPSSS